MTYIAHITPDTSTVATFPNTQARADRPTIAAGIDGGDAEGGTARGIDGGTAAQAPTAGIDCGHVVEASPRSAMDGGTSDTAPESGIDGGTASNDPAAGIDGGRAFIDTLGVILHLWHVQTGRYYRLRVVDGEIGRHSAELRLFFNTPAPAGQYNYTVEAHGQIVSSGILQMRKQTNPNYSYYGIKHRAAELQA